MCATFARQRPKIEFLYNSGAFLTQPVGDPPQVRSRTNMAHIRQPRPDYGLGFWVKDSCQKPFQSFKIFQVKSPEKKCRCHFARMRLRWGLVGDPSQVSLWNIPQHVHVHALCEALVVRAAQLQWICYRMPTIAYPLEHTTHRSQP